MSPSGDPDYRTLTLPDGRTETYPRGTIGYVILGQLEQALAERCTDPEAHWRERYHQRPYEYRVVTRGLASGTEQEVITDRETALTIMADTTDGIERTLTARREPGPWFPVVLRRRPVTSTTRPHPLGDDGATAPHPYWLGDRVRLKDGRIGTIRAVEEGQGSPAVNLRIGRTLDTVRMDDILGLAD